MFEQKEKEKSKAPPDFSRNIEKTPQRNSKIWLAVSEWVIEILGMEQCYIWAYFLQATEDVQEGITDEDYDLFYEIWQEFDPDGTQYMSYKNLLEFVDVLEPPLQICKPNKFKIIHMDIPIVRWTDPGSGEIKENMVFCTDILDALTQDFFARKGNPIDEPPHVDEIKVKLLLIYFQNFAFLYHFIKEFEKKPQKTRHGCATWKVCANCILR